MRYHAENCNTGAVIIIVADNRKDAHDAASAVWSGVPVEITTLQEFYDTNLWRRYYNTIESFLEDACVNIPDSNDATIVACLNRALGELTELRDYFKARLPEDSNGTSEIDEPKPTIH